MGKNARIQELELELLSMRKRLELADAVRDFIQKLSELPDDAVLLYTLSGQRTNFWVALAAKRLIERIEAK